MNVKAVDGPFVASVQPSEHASADARLIAAAPDLLATLIQAVNESGYTLYGPTDSRAAEHGEPPWVCNARAVIAKAENGWRANATQQQRSEP